MTYYRRINSTDIFVTIEQPLIKNESTNQYEQSQRFVCSFKFHQPPSLINGEYLRNEGNIIWFNSTDEAVNSGFAEAERRINQ